MKIIGTSEEMMVARSRAEDPTKRVMTIGEAQAARMRMIERRKQDRRRKLMASLGFMDRRVGSDRRRPVPGGGFQDSISTTISWEESIKKK